MEAYGATPSSTGSGAGPWRQSLPFAASHKGAGRHQGPTAREHPNPTNQQPQQGPCSFQAPSLRRNSWEPGTKVHCRQSGGRPSGMPGPRAIAAVPGRSRGCAHPLPPPGSGKPFLLSCTFQRSHSQQSWENLPGHCPIPANHKSPEITPGECRPSFGKMLPPPPRPCTKARGDPPPPPNRPSPPENPPPCMEPPTDPPLLTDPPHTLVNAPSQDCQAEEGVQARSHAGGACAGVRHHLELPLQPL